MKMKHVKLCTVDFKGLLSSDEIPGATFNVTFPFESCMACCNSSGVCTSFPLTSKITSPAFSDPVFAAVLPSKIRATIKFPDSSTWTVNPCNKNAIFFNSPFHSDKFLKIVLLKICVQKFMFCLFLFCLFMVIYQRFVGFSNQPNNTLRLSGFVAWHDGNG